MKSILIALILAPCLLMASCQHRCQDAFADADKAYCPAKPIGAPMVEYNNHLWKVVMLEHSSDCGCQEDMEYEWPNYEESNQHAHDVNKYRPAFHDKDGNLIPYGWLL